jgi:hypothetical protein
MKNPPLGAREIQCLQTRYRALAAQLGSFESLSQGSVMPQPPRAWIWTRKVRAKTVTLGLSAEKAQQMKSAIANYRALEAIIHEMQEITQNLILRAPEIPEKAQQKKCPKPALP